MKIRHDVDVVVVGAGLAGMYTALNIDKNLNVIVLSKENIDENNSYLAQGGIAACIKKDDEFDLHIRDTLNAGANVNDVNKLEQLVKCAPENIQELIDLGVDFDREKNGNIKSTMEGGHSRRRVLHAGGDATGKEIVKALVKQIRQRDNINVIEDVMAVNLIEKERKCIGITAIKNNNELYITSKVTVMATGGIGEVYNNSTNSTIATSDGIAMANKIGCEIVNMEFIQFHPTAFYSKDKGKKFLISEAVRGEGAILRNKNGERFMEKYDSGLELAPRDIVSRSIYTEMKETDTDHVYLDITHEDKEYIENRFPTIYGRCLENGIDMSKDFVPVAPVQHYAIGGIAVDMLGRTNISNLYACGECANTGVHGANRLASNSLLECLVFGKKISQDINEKIIDVETEYLEDLELSYLDEGVQISGEDIDILEIKSEIKEAMETYVGIVRWEKGLKEAKAIVEKSIEKIKSGFKYDREYIEAFNIATTASIIIDSSIKRKKSIGCHFRIGE